VIVANLASKPRLNTRPVWVVTGVAVLIGLVLTAVNLRLFLSSNQTLEEQIVRRDMLQIERDALASEFSEHATALERVPWKGLNARVNLVNEVLKEHSFSWSDLLDHLAEVLPWQVRVVTVSPSLGDEGVALSLEAISKDREGFLDLLDRMVADPYFEDPLPSRETWPESGKSSEYLFRMRVMYHPEGEVGQ
jgi:Tfp pilus assembly protein PilN